MKLVRSLLVFAEKTLSEIRWPKYFILAVGLFSTVFFTFYLQRIEYAHRVREFEYICRDASMRILGRLHSHELVLKTSAAFFESSDSVTYQDWKVFVTKSDIVEILPGIRKIGYSSVLSSKNTTATWIHQYYTWNPPILKIMLSVMTCLLKRNAGQPWKWPGILISPPQPEGLISIALRQKQPGRD